MKKEINPKETLAEKLANLRLPSNEIFNLLTRNK